MSDRIQEIRAKVAEATKALREQIPPQTDYAETVGAPVWAYGQRFVWDDPSYYAMDNAADLLDDLLAQLATLQSENAALREAQRWIPVGERLPAESGRYLVRINRMAIEELGGNCKFIKIKMFMNNEWAYGIHSPAWINGDLKDLVTHWQPLPAAPDRKEGAQDDRN